MTILITGANRGIGQALAELYQDRGETVIGTHRAPDAGHLRELDVTDPSSHAALAERLGDTSLELLVCNAGVNLDQGQALDDGYPPAMWEDCFAANVTGVFLTIQSFLPHLRRSDAPKIAIIGSQLGSQTIASGGGYIYCASKAAVLNLGRNLAVDLAPEGFAVGVYHPGWVRTDMGGDRADISMQESAQGLAARFTALNPETTGCFETWDGQAHAY
ncbi:SDR family oxidoreductase [Yoonia sp.]|uniref:SDR family oxidoreductase n=1 Tax=Yoonia sp. TaxID=2212373 RepID=UPI00397540F8